MYNLLDFIIYREVALISTSVKNYVDVWIDATKNKSSRRFKIPDNPETERF